MSEGSISYVIGMLLFLNDWDQMKKKRSIKRNKKKPLLNVLLPIMWAWCPVQNIYQYLQAQVWIKDMKIFGEQ